MDITQTRQIEQDVLPVVNAVQWDEATPIQLLGTGSQQAQKYPSDIDLFSAIKRTKVDDLAGIYNHMDMVGIFALIVSYHPEAESATEPAKSLRVSIMPLPSRSPTSASSGRP